MLFFDLWNRARNSNVIQLNLQAQKGVTSDSAAIPSQLIIAKWFQTNGSYNFDSEKRITTVSTVIVIGIFGIFGGVAGGPILSLADYYAPREWRLWIFIIPEFMSFACLTLMAIWGKSKKKIENINQREMTAHSMIKTQDFDSKIGVGPRSDIVAERAQLT